MQVRLDTLFDRQREQYGFCFTCEDCVHYDGDTETCIHEFPNQMHRLSRYTVSPRPEYILFCKDFDLG